MKNKIELMDLKNYNKDFKLEAELLVGTLIGCKDNKTSCIARIKEGTNIYGETSLGITDTSGTGLWIDLNELDNWILDATEIA